MSLLSLSMEREPKFSSIRDILNENSIFSPPTLSLKLRTIVMVELLRKHDSAYTLKECFWKIIAFSQHKPTIDRFIINRPISTTTFFYRIKNYLRKSHKQPEKVEEMDFQAELLLARRNLQLVENGIRMQEEIDLIYESYQEQLDTLEMVDTQLQKIKQHLKYNKINTMVQGLRKLFYPKMRILFSKQKVQYRPQKKTYSIKLFHQNASQLSIKEENFDRFFEGNALQ